MHNKKFQLAQQQGFDWFKAQSGIFVTFVLQTCCSAPTAANIIFCFTLAHYRQGWMQSSSSDLQKSLKFFPNLISQLFIAVREINYPSCFIVYYEIKQRRNYSVNHTANPALLPSELHESLFARFRPLSILPRTTRKKFEGTTGQSFYLESGDWMYMDLFTNHSKPTSIGQNHSHCLANYSNSVMIGYSGRKLPCKLLTIIYKEEPLPHNSLRSC